MEREMVGEKIMPAIFEAGYNLNFFDDEMLRTVGNADKGNLTLGSAKHHVVVLPGIERMPLESLRKLDAFVKVGGILVATRRMPATAPGVNVTDAQQAEFTATAQRLFGGTNNNVKFVEKDEDVGTAIKSLMKPDADISPSAKEFGVVHRETVDANIYFVANTSNQKRNVQITFRAVSEAISVWNAMNGTTTSADVRGSTTDTTRIVLNFEPYQSHVVVFERHGIDYPIKVDSVSTASSIDLSADWRVTFGKDAPVTMKQLHSWADDEATRYFSGVASYERSFDLPADFSSSPSSVTLDFGEGTALENTGSRNGMQTWYDPPIREAAIVYINGQRAGSLWCPPYKLDVTKLLKPGSNTIRIEVANTALNYMSGRKMPDYKLLTLRYGERFQAQDMDKIQVLPSGILGSVKLVTIK
jgi:hypothetical protein